VEVQGWCALGHVRQAMEKRHNYVRKVSATLRGPRGRLGHVLRGWR
jgi:hypothetical protein